MTTGILLAVVLGLVAAAFVVAPLLRRNAVEDELRIERLSEARELTSRQSMLLATLRDLEDDHDTEKLDDADYESLRARLTAETVEVMRRLDEIEARHAEEDEAAERASQPIQHPGSRRPGLTR